MWIKVGKHLKPGDKSNVQFKVIKFIRLKGVKTDFITLQTLKLYNFDVNWAVQTYH